MSKVKQKLHFGRYDYAAFACFATYALCSLVIPVSLVKMGEALDFPLDKGGLSDGGVLHMVRSVAVVITLMICGFLAVRYGKRYSMAISSLLMGGGILFCAFVPNYWFLLPCLLVAGLGEGICEGLATPFVERLHPQAPERYVNIAHSFWSVGIGFCVIIAGSLLAYGVNWRYVLGACGLLSLLVALMFLWPENPERRYPEEQENTSCAAIFRYSFEIAAVPRFWV
ncbi:MAG: MFS transporter, partial [Victivallaceae bacterium]